MATTFYTKVDCLGLCVCPCLFLQKAPMPGVILGSGFLKNTRKFEPLFFNSLASVRGLEGSVNPKVLDVQKNSLWQILVGTLKP